ncbi:hypothetical protein ES703_48059 [subsurface metagenome]
MMAISYDTFLIEHHFRDCLDIVLVGYCKKAMSDILVIAEVNKWFFSGGIFDDFVRNFFPVLVEHKDQAQLCDGRSFEIEPVDFGVIECFFMRPDGFTEFFKPGQSDEAETLESSACQLKVLNISVDSLGRILFQGTFFYPVVEIISGPCVLIVVVTVRRSGFAFDYPHDIIFVFFVELLLLGGADYVVRRSNTTAHIADYVGIKPKRFERPNFHTHDSMLDTRNRLLRTHS